MKSKENLQKEQLYREFVQREENLIHAPYNPELEFYSCIREGNVEKIKQLCNEPLTDKKGLGKLSENELQHFKISFCHYSRTGSPLLHRRRYVPFQSIQYQRFLYSKGRYVQNQTGYLRPAFFNVSGLYDQNEKSAKKEDLFPARGKMH